YSPHLNQELSIYNSIYELNKENVSLDSGKFATFEEHVKLAKNLDLSSFPCDYEVLTFLHDLPNLLTDPNYEELLGKMKKETKRLLVRIHQYRPSFFERVSDWGLSLTAQYELIRVHLLKFIAILPSLDHDVKGTEVKRILLESLRRLLSDSKKIRSSKTSVKRIPARYIVLFRIMYVSSTLVPKKLLAWLVRKGIRFMARRFIAGESIELARKTIKELGDSNRDVTLDRLGELVVSEKEADRYLEGVLELIRGFSLHYKKGGKNASGIYRANVSVKVSALCSQLKPEAFEYTYQKIGPRLKKILLEAKENHVFINIDAEHYHYRDVIFRVYKKLMLETEELKDYDQTGVVIQAYLKDAYSHFEEILDFAKKRGNTVHVRLVKGAYWDAETIEADAHGYVAPEFLNKEETDLFFRVILMKIMENYPHLQANIASHNFNDHVFSEILRNAKYENHPGIEHQCLHMTYEALSAGMAQLGWVVRNYIPIGSLIVGMGYLVRRIMENSSQVGVLTIMRSHKEEESLIDSSVILKNKKEKGLLNFNLSQQNLTDDFLNIPATRIYLEGERLHITEALEEIKKSFGKEYNNSTIELTGKLEEVNSSSIPELIVGKIKTATKEDAVAVVENAHEKYMEGSWAKTNWFERTTILIRAAIIMLTKRLELASLIVYEAGKTITEAIADVDEAIDFINFYARDEKRLSKYPDLVTRGVICVISPWNFPIAISCGMVAAPLVAGNTVILKSAATTPLIAQRMVDIFYEAGLEPGVLTHMPGPGRIAGQVLVDHPKVAMIVFTGSKGAGTMIANKMGKRIYHNNLYNMHYPSKAITEMGGKNAVIVTENAELDETMAGIIYSAFGHAGQKCSAASRIIVSNKVKEKLIKRLKEAVRDIEVGNAFDFQTLINPLISEKEKERLLKEVAESTEEVIKSGGKIIIDRTQEKYDNYCVGPIVYEVSKEFSLDDRTYCHHEFFAPVLHIIGFDTREEALSIYNSVEYGLTGGIFSQSQDDIDFFTDAMENGNIYVNRKITAARVRIEPFGGLKMSGTGPKAGSLHYVRSFHILKKDINMPVNDFEFDVAVSEDVEYAVQNINSISERIRLSLMVINYLSDKLSHSSSVLEDFGSWIDKELENYQNRHHPNRKIPGQESYNKVNMVKQNSVAFFASGNPDDTILMHVIAAIAVGSALNICCVNSKSYNLWKGLEKIVGEGNRNIKIAYLDLSDINKLLENGYLETILLDMNYEQLPAMLPIIYPELYHEKRMKHIYTPYDAPLIHEYDEFIFRFLHERSFAINTVRYGAPLQLEID
ncbi:bifunctional proline dehydrogenase/L-glutamate gamma-semialdehyde dehydrogenase, partial [Bacteroidota bacterium]